MTYTKPVAEKFYKQPSESYLVGADFSNVIESGEAIVAGSSTVTATDSNGEDASDDVIDNLDKNVTTADPDDIDATPVTNAMLQTRVMGGVEDNSPYKLTYKVVTDLGNEFELDISMQIKEV